MLTVYSLLDLAEIELLISHSLYSVLPLHHFFSSSETDLVLSSHSNELLSCMNHDFAMS